MPTQEAIVEKFGKIYIANDDTYQMGIHQDFADHVAERFKNVDTVLDACVGAGFTALAIVRYAKKVIAVDVDTEHLTQARENAQIANIESKIVFIEGDILKKLPQLSFDAAFLDPDWAPKGQGKDVHSKTLKDMTPALDVLFELVYQKTQNICLRLPKEFDLSELAKLPQSEIESYIKNGTLKFYCAYFGDLMRRAGRTEYRV